MRVPVPASPPEATPPSLPDPDRRLRRWGDLAWLGWLLFGGNLLLRDLREGGPGLLNLVLVTPVWAAWLLWLAIRVRQFLQRAIGAGEDHFDRAGSYYEFDGRPIRILFGAEDAAQIWIDARDVLDAFAAAGRARAPERIRQIAGRDGLVRAPGTRRLSFTDRGLRAWLDRRTEPVSAKFLHWYEAEVVKPHQKRRELQDAAG